MILLFICKNILIKVTKYSHFKYNSQPHVRIWTRKHRLESFQP